MYAYCDNDDERVSKEGFDMAPSTSVYHDGIREKVYCSHQETLDISFPASVGTDVPIGLSRSLVSMIHLYSFRSVLVRGCALVNRCVISDHIINKDANGIATQFAYNAISFMLIRILQQFGSVQLVQHEANPDAVPPPGWAESKGSNGKDKVKLRSYLTLFVDVSTSMIMRFAQFSTFHGRAVSG